MVDSTQLAAELAKCGNALIALAVLADKARLGRTAEVKAILQKHGAQKLSDIDPGEYAILLAEAEALR